MAQSSVGSHRRKPSIAPALAERVFVCDISEGNDRILGSAFHYEGLPGCRAMWERVWPTELFAHGDGGKTNRLLSGSFDFRQEKGKSRAAGIDRPCQRNGNERAENCSIGVDLVGFEAFREGALLIGQRRKGRIGPDRIIDLDVMSPQRELVRHGLSP